MPQPTFTLLLTTSETLGLLDTFRSSLFTFAQADRGLSARSEPWRWSTFGAPEPRQEASGPWPSGDEPGGRSSPRPGRRGVQEMYAYIAERPQGVSTEERRHLIDPSSLARDLCNDMYMICI